MSEIYDFDARRKARVAERRITLFGCTYGQMPDLPYEIGLDWLFFADDIKEMDAKAFRAYLTDLNRRTIDAVFGDGRFEEWTDPQGPHRASNDEIKAIVRYIRAGYIPEALEGELPPENPPAGATSEASSADTSAPSTATSGAATASDSVEPPPA